LEYVVFFPSPSAILTISPDCTNTIVERQCDASRHLPRYYTKPSIPSKHLLNIPYVKKIFNASHMAPFDVPHVTHDMILRFMGVDFSAIVGGSAKIPSSLGTVAKPVFVGEIDAKPTSVMPAKTPQQDKAMWEGM
jgi:hypothetical protein